MCKRWKRQLALLLMGLGGVAALLALLNLIPTNSFAWDETPTVHLTLNCTDNYTSTTPGEQLTLTFLLTTTQADTVALDLTFSPQLIPSVTLKGNTLTLPAAQPILPGVSLTINVAIVGPGVTSQQEFTITLIATSRIISPGLSITSTAGVVVSLTTPAASFPTPSPTASATPSPSPTASVMPSATPSPTPTASATPATPTTAPPIPQTPSPTEAAETVGGGPNIFIIVGLFGLLGVLVLALLLWRRPRRPKTKPIPTPKKPPPPRPVPAVPYLQSLATTGGPRKFLLDKPDVLIGRDENASLRIDETFDNWETVSRQHARIIRQGDQVIIQDNDSLNGITVNGRRTRRNLLKQGWRLEIGGVAFIFHAGGPPSILPTGGGGRGGEGACNENLPQLSSRKPAQRQILRQMRRVPAVAATL